MTPRHVLAVAVLVFGTLAGTALVITAAQGRGIDDGTAYAALAAALACIAAAIGVAIGWPGRRPRKAVDDTSGVSLDMDEDEAINGGP